MKRSTAKIDWTVVEEEEVWQSLQKTTPIKLPSKSPHSKEAALATLLVALSLLVFLTWMLRRPTPSAIAGADLQRALVLEVQSLTPSPLAPSSLASPSLASPSLASPPPALPSQGEASANNKVQGEIIRQVGNHALVQVITHRVEEGKLQAYRENRFYTREGHEWTRIPPDPALFGEQKTLTIANFTILYRDVDADAVYRAAPRLEQFFADLRQDFGVPAAEAGSPYTIEVAIDRPFPRITSYLHIQIAIPSPTLLAAPVEVSPATLLFQETVYPLASIMLMKSVEPHDAAWKYNFMVWYPFIDAIKLWEVWQADELLASARDPLVHWLYQNSLATTQPRRLPAGYEAFCRPYQFLHIAPLQVPPPLTCTETDRKLASWQYLAPLTRLRRATNQSEARSWAESPYVVEITGETVIEYIVATYGRAKLLALIKALGEHRTLDALIPALFDISVDEFDAGWQTYLAQRY